MEFAGNKSIITPEAVFIIGTYDENGVPNAMNAAWAMQSDTAEISSDCDDMTEDGNKYIEIRLLIHADSKQAAKEIIQRTPINAYFSSMCYDPSGVHISGPVHHMVSVDISSIPVFFLK